MVPNYFPIIGHYFFCRADFARKESRAITFSYAPWVHSIKKVASHQAAAATAKDVQARASCYKQMNPIIVCVEKALPQRMLVQVPVVAGATYLGGCANLYR